MNTPRVAAIITNYNHGRYLVETMLCLLQQTRPPDEIIVVDDASTDNSREILTEIARKVSRIRPVFNEKNEGVNRALNRAVALSDADYFTGLGADDPLFPFFIERAMKLMLANPTAGICCSEYQIFSQIPPGNAPMPILVNLAEQARYFRPREIAAIYRSRTDLSIPTAPALWRRSAWEEAGQLRPKLRWLADWFAAIVVLSRHGLAYFHGVSQTVRHDPKSHQNAGMAETQGFRDLLRDVLATLEEPAFADAQEFFKIPSVFARFGFKILHLLSHDPAYHKYLSADLVRNALQCEHLKLTWDYPRLHGTTQSQLIKETHSLLDSCAAALRKQARLLAGQGDYVDALEHLRKAVNSSPANEELRAEFLAISSQCASTLPAGTISARALAGSAV